MTRKCFLIFIITLFFVVLSFTACVTEDKYYTYELAGVPSNYKVNLFRAEFNGDYGQDLRIYFSSLKYESLRLEFRLDEHGEIDNGKIFLADDYKIINTEPYTLNIRLEGTFLLSFR